MPDHAGPRYRSSRQLIPFEDFDVLLRRYPGPHVPPPPVGKRALWLSNYQSRPMTVRDRLWRRT